MNTYIVRLFVPGEPTTEADLRGTVERVGGDGPRPFIGADQLVALLSCGLARPTPRP